MESTFETIGENAASPSTGCKNRRVQLLTPPPKTTQSYKEIVDWLTTEASPVPKRSFAKEAIMSTQKSKASFKRPMQKRTEPSKISKMSLDGTDSGVAADSEMAEETQVHADDSIDAERDMGTEHEHEPADPSDIMDWPVYQLALQLSLPQEALPQEKGRGTKNYTITGPSGCRVEIHLNNQAFYLKRKDDGSTTFGDTCRNLGWKKYGGVTEAWKIVKDKIGWDIPEVTKSEGGID